MKKTKLTAFLTSLTILGSLTLNTSGWTATAEMVTPVGLAITSPKTVFSTESVAEGNAKATIYVDVTTEFDESAMVTSVEFHLRSSAWGMFDPVNPAICDPNVVGTNNGNSTENLNCFSSVAGVWTTDDIPDVPYMTYNYSNSEMFEGYCDSAAPSVIIMTDSTLGKLRTGGEGAGSHLAQFEIMLPQDLPEGEYSIDFLDAKSIIGDTTVSNGAENVEITNLQGITFTVTSDYVEPEYLLGDANCDGIVNVRDCALIASKLSVNLVSELPAHSDYTQDGEINVRDAAAIARLLAEKK